MSSLRQICRIQPVDLGSNPTSMKSEERSGKYQAEIKLQKARLEAEQIRAGQCMSNLAQAKTELAVALEANAGGGLTPSIVLENDQLKQARRFLGADPWTQ